MQIQKKKNQIIIKKDEQFDVKDTLECGQIFSFEKNKDGFYIVYSGEKFAKIFEDNLNIIVETNEVNFFYNFFDLETDYQKIKQKLKNFKDFSKYLDFGKGIRLLRQEPLQTILSFIVSANNNIKRIKSILKNICKKYGKKLDLGYGFPSLKDLSLATESDFLQLGAGYRSKYLFETIKKLNQPDFDFNKLNKLKTNQLKTKLMALNGVGPKVCDCILLFGFSRFDVFPVDTWIRKSYYLFSTEKKSDIEISKFFVKIFKNYSGYAQQYLYNYMLNKNISIKKDF